MGAKATSGVREAASYGETARRGETGGVSVRLPCDLTLSHLSFGSY